MCARCLVLEGIVMAQKIEIAFLRAEINRLKRIIAGARSAAAVITTGADQVMSSHQPRGKWAYAKGAKQSAQAIGRRLAG